MSPATVTHVQELLDQLDRLKTLHRAAETPSFGQVEALFDQAAVVRASLAVPDHARPAGWPTTPGQGSAIEKTARHLVELVAASIGSATGAPR